MAVLLLLPIAVIILIVGFFSVGDIFKTLDLRLPQLPRTESPGNGQGAARQSRPAPPPPNAPSQIAPASPSAPTTTPEESPQDATPTISPYLNKLQISRFTPARSGKPFSLTLSEKLSAGQTLDITDWTVSGNTGTFKIGPGAQRIIPTNPSAGDRLLVKDGDKILVSGAQSPFGGEINFRPNTCFVYLKPYYTFPLSVPSSCPERKPTLQDIATFTPACQDFLLKRVNYSSCTTADQNNPDYGIVQDSVCRAYIADRFSYDSCRKNHSAESNYLKNEWHIYKNRTFGHATHDTIRLLDEYGLLVHTHIY